jgi:hypothetical protein
MPDHLYIPISAGRFVCITASDCPEISRHRWTYVPSRSGYTGYAARWITVHGKKKTVYMHRQLLHINDRSEVDHISGDGLDNSRCNIRRATSSQNKANKHHRIKTTYRGVYPTRYPGQWKAQTKSNGKNVHLGVFTNPEDAAKAYDEFARQSWGSYAQVNFQ